jgi:O-antigen ligase
MLNLLRDSGRNARLYSSLVASSEAGVVAFALVIAVGYWQVDQHVVFLVFFLLSFLLLIERGPELAVRGGAKVSLFLFLIFLFWLTLSTLWSQTFHLSLAYAGLIILTGTTAITLGASFGLPRVAQGLTLGVLVIVAHGLLTAVISGGSAFQAAESSDRGGSVWGLFTNPVGLSVLLGLASFSFFFGVRRVSTGLALGFGLGLFLLYGIESINILTPKVALVGCGVVALGLWHLRVSPKRLRPFFSWIYVFVGSVVGGFFWNYREPVLRAFGEGPDFSGRIVIWESYFEAFLWRPFFGTGWGSSVGMPPLNRDYLFPVKDWFLAHNGFIDIGIMLGGIGALFFFVLLFSLFITGAKRGTSTDYSVRWLFIPVTITYLTLNDAMSSLFPRFLGIFLVGLMVGTLLRESPKNEKFLSKIL